MLVEEINKCRQPSELACGPPNSWFLPLSSASGDNNIYEVMPSPVLLVSPLHDTGSTNATTVSPHPSPLKPPLTWCLPSLVPATVPPGRTVAWFGNGDWLSGIFPYLKTRRRRRDWKETARRAFVSGLEAGVGLHFPSCLCFLHWAYMFPLYTGGKG